ncbi:TetR/AcrR family transcriptional regulator C-terminal ligand-binding domain-containing protein [Mycobacterium paraense]|jgi:AcrR family transcriptional regulator|uniref:TetR family transcriptional regulator n=1 Tax=Mycobacterium paraense TaxID=767916 RepID=A0A1X2ADK4_9MYCO|nr:TetR-like C-terminal domain-containing protein [Mycobacterium paraense]MCV7443348.1 TetR/AcrR family transcriptional regulator C-terminal ligand-binding domain-containing protein [Mycobacterium paraense]ORW39731.1 TetR family transcriptional regulator [Mycobacterium paraense]ORW49306.1 TetR family transcriptional regulator [Mycobacterium paraense]
MQPSQPPDESVPADVRARVMVAALDELSRWGVERFSIEALAERHHLDPAMIHRFWGNRQRLIVAAALADAEAYSSIADTGSLHGDLLALARKLADRINSPAGRAFMRALVMDRRGPHDEETRMMVWEARFAVVREVIDRAGKRGDLRDDVNTLAAVQAVLAPLNVRALYSDAPIDDRYCEAVADMAWHALARK